MPFNPRTHLTSTPIRFTHESLAHIQECTLNMGKLDLLQLKMMPKLELLRIAIVCYPKGYVNELVDWLSDKSKWGVECAALRTIRVEAKTGNWDIDKELGHNLVADLLCERAAAVQ